MILLKPTAEEAAAGLRAMTMVARAPGAIHPAARSLIDAAQRVLLDTRENIDSLAEIAPDDLARALPRPEIRQQLVQGMIVVSLSDGEPPQRQAEMVERFAGALDVHTPALRALRHLAHHDILFFTLCVLRNSHLPDAVRDQVRRSGLAGLVRNVLSFRGVIEQPDLAARYHALERLPDDRLGKHLWRHYQANGFAFPGEKGGFPEAAVYHDFTHVLAGYNTTPEGETLIGGFTAGYRERRPQHGFFVALFVISTFSTGVDVTPIGAGARTGTVGKVAEQWFEAIRRGSAMSVDLSDGWDHWPWVELPLEEARHRLRIPPKQGGHPWDYD